MKGNVCSTESSFYLREMFLQDKSPVVSFTKLLLQVKYIQADKYLSIW